MAALEQLLTPLTEDELRATRWIHGEFASFVDQYVTSIRDNDAHDLMFSPLFLNLGIEVADSRERFRQKLPRGFSLLNVLLGSDE